MPISDFISDRGEWRTHLFQHILPEPIFLEVLDSFALVGSNSVDNVLCEATLDGAFFVGSAYNLVTREEVSRRGAYIWHLI